MKVMLDTNILVLAFVFKSKKMNELIYKLSVEHEIVICSYTIEELKELVDTKFKVTQKDLDEFLKDFPFILVYSPTTVENKLFEIRDKNDYIILHTAIKGKVVYKNDEKISVNDYTLDDIKTVCHCDMLSKTKYNVCKAFE